MSLLLKNDEFNKILKSLGAEYQLLAPVRLPKRGRFSDTDLIRYGEIATVEEIVWREKSHFSPKEVLFPINQTLFFFIEDEPREPQFPEQNFLLFLRPCDINGIRRLDTIFLQNGPHPDLYYQRIREKVKFALIECRESFENCFCVSMGSNYTENYSMALRFNKKEVLCEIKDQDFQPYFASEGGVTDFIPGYVRENPVKVSVPEASNITLDIFDHPLWQDYAKRCTGCGRCNMSCITCSCFTTWDFSYEDNPKAGERRRVWAGCHVDKFTDMAGGHSFRKDYGSRMRFKTMHKVFDYRKRFGEQMCVGCGRCDDRCPEYISFAACINKLNQAAGEDKNDGKS